MIACMRIAIEQVWEAFHVPLFQSMCKQVHDEATADDTLQEVFLRETLQSVNKLKSWIYHMTRNAIIDFYRSARSMHSLDRPEVLDLPEELPDDDIVGELLLCMRAMVNSLSEQDRQALVLSCPVSISRTEKSERM
jgi:RNA polymerase sigma-70 factor, ECF subfamily